MSEVTQDYLRMGEQLQKAGLLDKAVLNYQQALSLDPKEIKALNALREIYCAQGKLEEALAACHKIIQIQPTLAETYISLGKILNSRKTYEVALRAYSKAIQLDPISTEAHIELGSLYQRIGKVDLAISSYQTAISLDSHQTQIYQKLISLLSQKGRLSEVRMYQKQILEINSRTNLRNQIDRLKREGQLLNIIIGSSGTHQEGWISTDIQTLNLLKPETWKPYFSTASIDAILAEHVWEHLSQEEGIIAAKVCYQYLKAGSYLRVAVPDGFHPHQAYIDAVKPGGCGAGADDHKMLYNYLSFKEIFEVSGFKVDLLEYFDAEGQFHCQDWNPLKGMIQRSKRFDRRNQDGGLNYTSIILDAKKPLTRTKSKYSHSQYKPSLNYLESSGWLNSIKLHKPINLDLKPIPWYTYPAIEFIEGNLQGNYKV
ncbi:MAG: tetratricopeptide repeat protein, partial [Geitlerinemataceae cyanobacterium]